MPQAQDSERSEIIDRAVEAAERTGRQHDELRPFLARYYRHVPVEDLAERDPIDLVGPALSHRLPAGSRPRGAPDARGLPPTAVEIDRETDPERLEHVRDGVRSVLDDVRVAVEDWPKMKQRARDLAAELEAAPPAGPPSEEVEEGQALLRWLADDHFTFLGYREY